MKYTPTIGIECHVQLATKTKLLSPVDNDARDKSPNTCVSPGDYALPGTVPVLNHQAVLLAITAGHALKAEIAPISTFDRKHYFYPDLPSGYQTTQMRQPIIGPGKIDLPDGSTVRIHHAHLEEDAAKLTHYPSYSLIDLNRAGTPLIEIVSQPDIHSAEQARLYCEELHKLMTYTGVSLGDLYHGNMRFDVNVSIAPEGSTELGTRTEIKNLNSFRSIERAAAYEISRHIALLEKGDPIMRETRGWSDATGKTTAQRSKEQATDYRYIPEPTVPSIHLDPKLISERKSALPLLPSDYRQIFAEIIPKPTLETLLNHQLLIEKVYKLYKLSTPVITQKISSLLTSVLLAEENLSLTSNPLPPTDHLIELATMTENNELSSTSAKQIFLALFSPKNSEKSPRTLAKELNLLQENDTAALEKLIDEVLALPACATAITDFKSGEEKALSFLTGQIMKLSKGKANPTTAQKLLRTKLSQPE